MDPGFVGPEAFTTLKSPFKKRNKKIRVHKYMGGEIITDHKFLKVGKCHKHHKNPENNIIFLLINLVAHIYNICHSFDFYLITYSYNTNVIKNNFLPRE